MKLMLLGFLIIIASFSVISPVKAISDHLVISEIQVGGTSGNDEFVEIYNPTDSDINLTGWYITRHPSGGSEINFIGTGLSKTITSHGYFLLANSAGIYSSLADLTYGTGFTTDSTITLYSDNKITKVDQVGFGTASLFEVSPAPNPPTGQSIERTNNIDTDNNTNDFQINSGPDPHNSTFIETTPSPEPTLSPTPTESPTPTPTESLTPSPTPTPTPSPSPTPTEIPTPVPTPFYKTPPGWLKSPVFTCRNSHIPPFTYLLIKSLMPWKFHCSS